ncbi:hypothetical protein DL95DRAFT_459558 [Leptodontidium sp. 2 PMI_412]|nr:hypothetical protein DL95DRAFT_459558 [Leptodontidium sp. 2 PMI_412]
MVFTLTPEHVREITTPIAGGDWSLFLDALDPEVRWMVVDSTHDPVSLAGINNVESWKKDLMEPLGPISKALLRWFSTSWTSLGIKRFMSRMAGRR